MTRCFSLPMKPWPAFRATLGVVLTASLTWALHTKLGPAPPVGPFLNPFSGFWRNMESGTFQAEELRVPGLQGPVRVVFDDRRIPHVFAQNDHDLYVAQGYLTARDRLWQMEFQTRVAAGRVSEIVGDKALGLDRYQRRLGMPAAAQIAATEMMRHPTTRAVVQAYCDGVNARIRELSAADLPFEYKLLDYRPEPWTALQCGLLLKLMAYDLAGSSSDYKLDNIRQAIGQAATDDLFPNYTTREDPIVPVGTPPDFPYPAPPPVPEDSSISRATPSLMGRSASPSPVTAFEISPEEAAAIGSNNWAVSGRRTATGYPLLANDPHLALNLPSIWYQIQLSAPGVNVYGASLPGAPAVVSGFNEKVAWGVTNVGADVLDFYRIQFRDGRRREYRVGNAWKPIRLVLERIKVRGQADVIDTVRWTSFGPIARDRPEDKPFNAQLAPGCAVRWTAQETSNELFTFYRLNRAASYTDYTAALTSYICPAQNFAFASIENDVAMWANGRFPMRYSGQGKYVLDGAAPRQQWQDWVVPAANPHVRNPERGFVSSANQHSAGPEYPYYLGWDFANYSRGHRINEVLGGLPKATHDDMRALQNDIVSINARDLLPTLLPLIAAAGKPAERKAVDLLTRWDYRYAAEAPQPAIWEVWQGLLMQGIWKDELGGSDATPMRYPSRERLRRLLMEQADTTRWFDDVTTTNRRETRPDIVQAAFRAAIDSLVKTHGPDPAAWQWWRQKGTDVMHVARLKGFGFDDVAVGGGAGIVNATAERAGPSWRMVVALDPKGPQAWGVYPGGQSGNPGSPFYADQFETWRKGELYPLLFLHSADDRDPHVAGQWSLKGE